MPSIYLTKKQLETVIHDLEAHQATYLSQDLNAHTNPHTDDRVIHRRELLERLRKHETPKIS